MKCPKGFRGKYFSLAAILALNATVTIANETQSAVDIEAKMTPKEFASSEEETPPLELVPVVVVSKKIKVAEIGAPFASEVYTKKEIEKSHSKDIYEFLNSQTSITTMPSYGNPFTQNIDMRGYGLGYGYENTVITLNGRRLNNIDMSPQLLSSIPLDSIDKIEIIRGSGSVEYGDGANAGVINIITKDYDGAVIKSYFGDNGLWFGSLGVGIKQEKFSVSGYIDDYSHDGFKHVSNDGTKDESWNRNKSIKATFTPTDDLKLNIGKTFSTMNVNYANALTLTQYRQDPYFIPVSQYADSSYKTDVINYGFNYKINDKVSVDTQVFDEDKKVSSYYVSSNGTIGGSYDYKSFDSKLNYADGNFKALLGVQAFDGEKESKSTWSPDSSVTKENLGIYTKADYTFGSHTVSAGARNESIKYTFQDSVSNEAKRFSENAYDVGYNYKFNSNTSFFTNYNHSFQAADIDRLFKAIYNTSFPWNYLGSEFNGILKPMQVDTINVGFNYLTSMNKFKTSLFFSAVENEIYLNSLGDNAIFKETEKKGIEIFDKYNFSSNLFTTVNYTYVDTKIIDDGLTGAYNGNEIPGVSPHTFKISLGYNPTKPITLLLSETYKSKAYAIDNFDGSYGKMESYSVTDFAATYTYKNYEFYTKINNLFDERNAIFVKGFSSLGVYPVNYERTFMLGMSAKF